MVGDRTRDEGDVCWERIDDGQGHEKRRVELSRVWTGLFGWSGSTRSLLEGSVLPSPTEEDTRLPLLQDP